MLFDPLPHKAAISGVSPLADPEVAAIIQRRFDGLPRNRLGSLCAAVGDQGNFKRDLPRVIDYFARRQRRIFASGRSGAERPFQLFILIDDVFSIASEE